MNLNKGINITEGKVPAAVSGVATNISALLVNAVKGPVNVATLTGSMPHFERIFGTENALGTTGHKCVDTFFAKAGSAPLWVVRVASATAAKSSLTIQDRQTPTPADTVKIEAASEGTHGDYTQVEIADDNILSTVPSVDIDASAVTAKLQSIGGLEVGSWVEFDNGTNQEQVQITGIDTANKEISWTGGLTFAYTTVNATAKSQEFKVLVYYKNNLVETFKGLSVVDAVSFHLEKKVTNDHIKVTDMKSSDAGFTDMPAVTAKTALTGGNDGLADVTGSDYEGSASLKTGVYAFDEVKNLFRIGCPNPKLTDADPAVAYKSLVQKLHDYSDGRLGCQVYEDIPFNKTPAEAITWQESFEGRKLCFWYPWANVSTDSGLLDIPCSAAVMGAAVRKDANVGAHKSVGNEPIGGIVALERDLGEAESNTLNDAHINTVENINGIRTWGSRSQSVSSQYLFIEDSEYWEYLAMSFVGSLQPFAFGLINQFTANAMKRVITNFLKEEFDKGAITEFAVVCDLGEDSNNPQSQIDQGILKIDIGYKRAGTAEKIWVPLTNTLNSGVTVA